MVLSLCEYGCFVLFFRFFVTSYVDYTSRDGHHLHKASEFIVCLDRVTVVLWPFCESDLWHVDIETFRVCVRVCVCVSLCA